MKFTEVMSRFRLFDHGRREYENPEVSIVVSKPSIGGIAKSAIKYIGQGIDWDHGHILITPEHDLVPKTNDERIWEMTREFLMWLATKPVKRASYEINEARRILDHAGIDYMKYQRILHREMSK